MAIILCSLISLISIILTIYHAKVNNLSAITGQPPETKAAGTPVFPPEAPGSAAKAWRRAA
jgi:5,10-methylenetetrahydrofolate reductase